MDSTLHEIAADLFRISTFHPEYGIQFNQFLLKDDEPFLMHTGFRNVPVDVRCCGIPNARFIRQRGLRRGHRRLGAIHQDNSRRSETLLETRTD